MSPLLPPPLLVADEDEDALPPVPAPGPDCVPAPAPLCAPVSESLLEQPTSVSDAPIDSADHKRLVLIRHLLVIAWGELKVIRAPTSRPQSETPLSRTVLCLYGCIVSVAESRVVLRYFDCRGRAEALREALLDAGVPFVDDRVPIG